ncbi:MULTISPECIES: flagellar basal body L-ring protein FlgH [Enterobacter]|jgi:flagellar L-ring protein precursor FlgH|uniref:Flagellar L-ring protein n=2 Tax=Enterobacter TaxID=547 RepID=A0A3R9NEM1_9ENTR|nr:MULTISPECIES: flagellar basal body L-ring protein FlgH [Enterobacter]MCS5451964.1 flagellar basal body L-ring protein FlgH [Enterobacter huaxiensis]MCV2534260.1 flagellar basal body L-ring protein FlgH [Enterobacter wuhouensis]MEB7544954.1 flagellar basal body L-ring protein FlgH [Enterobacter huaxiensis]MEB7583205.1 flagellar basal body L-ring protein FlgH [Enterobacter huaxiensis]MEB7665396.1 flagellar basal body L-ring protein FlgH [Enterobacter huaxiensis]
MKKQLVTGFFVLLLAGCESPALLVHKDDAAYAPPEDFAMPPAETKGGGLYNANYNWSLTQDRRAYRVGDILTVKLDESTQASKQARTNFGKKNDVSIGIPEAFGHSVDKLSGSIDGNRNFNGNATSQQQNSLRGAITVAVYKVLPNGVLAVRGEKWLTLNQGDEYMRVTGLVRAEDIERDNSVSSQRIANARISYAGRGALSDANSAGWLTRFFNHPLFPI